MQVRSTGKQLTRWGFTPQKPIKRAHEQSPAAVPAWPEGEYPAIEQRARAEGAEIHWGDETARVVADVRGRRFAPAGKTPAAMAVGGTRQKLSLIATVTNQVRQAANDHMAMLAQNPECVMSYFQNRLSSLYRLRLYRAGTITPEMAHFSSCAS